MSSVLGRPIHPYGLHFAHYHVARRRRRGLADVDIDLLGMRWRRTEGKGGQRKERGGEECFHQMGNT
ncbi:hypothetical protein GCM10011383_10820 [Hymenobacter cavernae]|uniref:Uncharacterized protein n=1 Tax=Hymenobacter cavernae TaxID=2044852 RepID=A0ABQ1TRP5_9BACT|nr:hypothetical protein GCM10011383_10820 [Hymenobacter cavernae]